MLWIVSNVIVHYVIVHYVIVHYVLAFGAKPGHSYKNIFAKVKLLIPGLDSTGHKFVTNPLPVHFEFGIVLSL